MFDTILHITFILFLQKRIPNDAKAMSLALLRYETTEILFLDPVIWVPILNIGCKIIHWNFTALFFQHKLVIIEALFKRESLLV